MGEGPRLPWRDIVRWAVMGTAVGLLLVLADVSRTGRTPVNLLQPGEVGPSVLLIREDFPDVELPGDDGLDGQQFYAVARNPFDLDDAASHLDRPRYRLQRPLLPWVAWLLHPAGGGTGLIAALLVVGIAGSVIGGLAMGALSTHWRGPAWVGATFGVLPGTWWSLRTTVADALSVGLALLAILLSARARHRAAAGVASLAVLAKETAATVLVGWLLATRRRTDAITVGVAGVVAVTWAVFLRVRLPGDEAVGELTVPLTGLVDAFAERWLEGDELRGLLGTGLGLVLAGLALWRRRLRHPLSIPIVVQLVFLTTANGDVLGNDFGGGRACLAVTALSITALAAPAPSYRPDHHPETTSVGPNP